ncbi:MAG: hypothetical protein NVS3B6_11490 [Pseudarthrobacter sp.]
MISATLESTADGILVVRSDGKIAGYNEQFATMWGIPTSAVCSPAGVPGVGLQEGVDLGFVHAREGARWHGGEQV